MIFSFLITPVVFLVFSVGIPEPGALTAGTRNADEGKKYLEIIKAIYSEVKELNAYPGEDFIRRDFFIGAEDDDDTYKDIHVSILIQRHGDMEKMKVRVTPMKPGQGDRRVKYAGMSKMLICLISEKNIELESSDFKEKEISGLVEEVLQAVRNKKKLLSLCSRGGAEAARIPALTKRSNGDKIMEWIKELSARQKQQIPAQSRTRLTFIEKPSSGKSFLPWAAPAMV